MARKRVKKHKRNFFWPSRPRLTLPALIIIIGLLFITVSLAIKIHYAVNLTFTGYTPSSSVIRGTTQPVEIAIPSLNIKLPLSETVIKNGVWQISPLGASHLTSSAVPGEKGNIIIYAHNTNDRFGHIMDIKKGARIVVTSLDGKQHSYEVIKTATVSPDQIDLLLPTAFETLTVYTCTGFFDSKRFVVVSKPI